MRRIPALLACMLLVAALAIAAAACGDDDEDGVAPTATAVDGGAPTEPADGASASVAVTLTEYILSPDSESAPAGPVTFTATNIGGDVHELLVLRTDLAPDALPTVEGGAVDEAGDGFEVLGEVEELDPLGGEDTLTLELKPGAYVLICNVIEDDGDSHYALGMFAAFEVTE